MIEGFVETTLGILLMEIIKVVASLFAKVSKLNVSISNLV